MKKIVINLTDATYEKFRFEAIKEKKNIQTIIEERIYHKPFDEEVKKAYEDLIDQEINKILGE